MSASTEIVPGALFKTPVRGRILAAQAPHSKLIMGVLNKAPSTWHILIGSSQAMGRQQIIQVQTRTESQVHMRTPTASSGGWVLKWRPLISQSRQISVGEDVNPVDPAEEMEILSDAVTMSRLASSAADIAAGDTVGVEEILRTLAARRRADS